jgi:GxxExxY protein
MNELGSGFLEKVYERSMMVQFRLDGLQAMSQANIDVTYSGVAVGEYYADLLVENELIVEVKCASGIDDAHVAQVLNYLKATGKRLALIINFGQQKVQIKRVVNDF